MNRHADIAGAALVLSVSLLGAAEAYSMRLITQNQEQRAQYPAQAEAVSALAEAGFDVNRSEYQAGGLDLADGLRLLSTRAFDMAAMEAELWDVAINTNGTAQACSTGDDCPDGRIYTSYDMTLVSMSEADKAKVAEISASAVLPEWASKCEASYQGAPRSGMKPSGRRVA